jgi:hypothetical protein
MMNKSILATLAAMTVLIALSVPNANADWLERVLGRGKTDEAPVTELSTGQIGAGLKEALEVGTARVVDMLGQTDGFNADPLIHIPLPESLTSVQSALSRVGMSDALDDLELRLNRAAEAATPQAKALFLDAIRNLTMEDVMEIYQGPDDAATQYLRAQMSTPLADAMNPVVDQSLADVGAAQSYETVMTQYNALPLVPKAEADLTTYVVDMGLDGIFTYLAKEESAIRNEPVKRTTDLLKQVFGGG